MAENSNDSSVFSNKFYALRENSDMETEISLDKDNDFSTVKRKTAKRKSDHLDSKNYTKPKKDSRIIPVTKSGNETHTQSKSFTSEPVTSRFDKDNSGPFGIWIKKIDPNKEINVYEIGSLIYKDFKSASISRKSKFAVEVLFDYRSEANRFLEKSDAFKNDHGLNVFIPGHRQSRKGLIKYIPEYITNEQILESSTASTKFHILSVRRITVKNRNYNGENDQYISTDKVVITFAGQEFPKNFRICLVNTDIFPYVSRPMQCFNCFKFGHTAARCKSSKKCAKCGDDEHKEDEEKCEVSKLSCVNCKENHSSLDKASCKEYNNQVKINTIMAYDNISFIEAKKLVLDSHNNRNIILTKENFPNISHKNKNIINLESNNSRPINQNKTFAKAASNGNTIQAKSPQPNNTNTTSQNDNHLDIDDAKCFSTSTTFSLQDHQYQVSSQPSSPQGLTLLADTAISNSNQDNLSF